MAINFPDQLDSLGNPNGTDSLASPSHSQQHADANDAIEAIEAVIGITNSEDTSSLTYKINNLAESVNGIGNATTVVTELLGLDGNNDLTVTGIENKTSVDSFDLSVFRTVKYDVQLSRGNEYYTSTLLLLNDGNNINVVESNIISNTDNSLADVTFEENAGIISLCVTPVANTVTVRYIRSALKA